MKLATVFIALLLLLPVGALANYDEAGTDLNTTGNDNPAEPGDPCGTCPDPWGTTGSTFVGPDLWVLANSVIYHLQDCSVVESIAISPPLGNSWGLGYDSTRDLFIVADPGADVLTTVDMTGARQNTWPTPTPGPVGLAYDPTRDLYWISDWMMDVLSSMNPDGTAGPIHSAPAGSRIAGTGFDEANDAIVYHGRNEAMGYWIDAESGGFIDSYNVPMGGGNNGTGAGVDPATSNVWIGHYEQPTLFCVEGLAPPPTATETSTWSCIKSLY